MVVGMLLMIDLRRVFFVWMVAGVLGSWAWADSLDAKQSAVYARIKAHVTSVPAIDTHDHIPPFELIGGRVETDQGRGMTLHSLWQSSYYTWFNPVTSWPKSGRFDEWWSTAKRDFDHARATSFYRYQLPAFRDLYGVDFDQITDVQAADVNRRIFENYRTPAWLHDVITNRANIELMVMDPYWNRLGFSLEYAFAVPTVNVTGLTRGFHSTEFASPNDSPFLFAGREKLPLNNLDDYLVVVERILEFGKARGAVCLKTTLAYERTLDFSKGTREVAESVWGRPRNQLTSAEIQGFEDYVMGRIVGLSAKFDLPFQIHTGHARIQGSNPMLLVPMIASNPKTKFILFHGGYPWVGETGAIATRHKNVWIDSVWLPTISYTMAKRAYQEWLEVVPSNRILWGADAHHAEGVYGATEFTRQCLAEALAEKVIRGELPEAHALRIGGQIMRENALELFPGMKAKLWKAIPGKVEVRR